MVLLNDIFPALIFLLTYGLCGMFKLPAETMLNWISVAYHLQILFALLAWIKIQKCSQKIARLDQQITAEINKYHSMER